MRRIHTTLLFTHIKPGSQTELGILNLPLYILGDKSVCCLSQTIDGSKVFMSSSLLP